MSHGPRLERVVHLAFILMWPRLLRPATRKVLHVSVVNTHLFPAPALSILILTEVSKLSLAFMSKDPVGSEADGRPLTGHLLAYGMRVIVSDLMFVLMTYSYHARAWIFGIDRHTSVEERLGVCQL